MRVLKMSEVDLRGKRVLVRVDFNVPIQNGKITDDTRIRAAVRGIREALAQVAKHLSALLGRDVPLKRDWLDGVAVEPGQAVLLENCRFNKGEKKDDDALAKQMAGLCDVY